MPRILEINRIDELAQFRQEWHDLLQQTAGASFFQSLEWLEVYWRHFGQQQRLRVLVVSVEDRPAGILPLVVQSEKSKVGRVRTLTFPLHEWGSFYGPVGPNPELILTAGLEHIRRTPRDWDILELRWQGAVGTDPSQTPGELQKREFGCTTGILPVCHGQDGRAAKDFAVLPSQTQRAMLAAGFQSYATLSNRTAIVDLNGNWDAYWSARKGAWLRRFRHDERKLAEQGSVSYVRFRPTGDPGDDSPRWDLYDACEEIARRSWQGEATDGTTLSHEAVRGFLREMHETAAAAGAADLNLLLLDDVPVAFIYGYHYRGYVYGLRRGYDEHGSRAGAGNVLLACTLRDSFARGDRIYDMGVGSYESKRHFQTRLIPILRYSHYPPAAPRTQLLRLKRWWQSRRLPGLLAAQGK